ncbi:MAG: Coenzyme F420 hydrogenase/dehydrogenase, beta subunit C-terminal domain [Candidatus Methanofastidiosia archaeon]|jgi:coenzyme F420 hydrogenase subunit beta
MNPNPTVGFFELSGCSGCVLSLVDHPHWDELLENLDVQFFQMITDEKNWPEKMDIAFVEGAVAAVHSGELKEITEIRKKAKILVALGACAATANILAYATGNQMPMPELDAFLSLSDLVTVDYAIPGCPPTPEIIARFITAVLSTDEEYLTPFALIAHETPVTIRDIVRKGLCISCGLCISVCPTRTITTTEGKPVIRDELCVRCGECYFQCPASYSSYTQFGTYLFGDAQDMVDDDAIGKYKEIYEVRTTDRKIKKFAQEGGAVTALFAYALDENIIDGALLGKKSENQSWLGEPIVVTNSDELYKTAGTKYTVTPVLSRLKDALSYYGLSKIGLVGVSCQILSSRKLQYYPLGLRDVSDDIQDRIALRIGLFCTSNFRYNAMVKMVEEVGEIRPEDVYKTDIEAGKYLMHSVTEEIITIPLDVVHEYEQEACGICPDFTSELADVSVGSIGSTKGWSTVIVRTDMGQQLVENAEKEGYITVKESNKKYLQDVKKFALMKKKRSEKNIKTRRSYGLPVPFY